MNQLYELSQMVVALMDREDESTKTLRKYLLISHIVFVRMFCGQ